MSSRFAHPARLAELCQGLTALLVIGQTVSQPRDPVLLAGALAAFEDGRGDRRLAKAFRLQGELLLWKVIQLSAAPVYL